MRACYEKTMSEWLGCEAIVKQREKEQHAVALAKCSSMASMDSNSPRVVHRDSSISNEVHTVTRTNISAWTCPQSFSDINLTPGGHTLNFSSLVPYDLSM